MAQTSMYKTFIIFYSITKGIFKIYQIERVMALQKHQSLMIYSFIFIHSVISENDKIIPLIVCNFHTK